MELVTKLGKEQPGTFNFGLGILMSSTRSAAALASKASALQLSQNVRARFKSVCVCCMLGRACVLSCTSP